MYAKNRSFLVGKFSQNLKIIVLQFVFRLCSPAKIPPKWEPKKWFELIFSLPDRFRAAFSHLNKPLYKNDFDIIYVVKQLG